MMYPFYEKAAKAGIRTVAFTKASSLVDGKSACHAGTACAVGDVGRAARTGPQLTLPSITQAIATLGGPLADATREWSRADGCPWLSDLAEIQVNTA